jgi:hypothetical protein
MERKNHIPKCLSGKVVLAAMALSAAVSVSASAAVEDLTVLEGQSLTLSGRSDYGRVVVNGDLVIAPGAEITAASLCVATNITGTASLVMEENSSLNVTGAGVNTIFGISGGTAYVELKSEASFNANEGEVWLAYDNSADTDLPYAKLVVSNATFATKGNVIYPEGRNVADLKENIVSEIRLDEGAVLKAISLKKQAFQTIKVLFNGGSIRHENWNGNSHFFYCGSNNGSSYILEGTNGCPVSVWVGASLSALFGLSSMSSLIEICGDGDFSLSGSKSVRIASKSTKWNNNIRFRNQGALRFSNVNANFAFSEFLRDTEESPAHDIVVENGATLDIRGCEAAARSLTLMGSGAVTNSETAVSTLVIGSGDGDSILSRRLPPRIGVVKKGAGVLSMFASDAESIKVENGELKLLSRGVMGYPIYRFNVYSTGNVGNPNARVRIGEFNLLKGNDDVTQGWSALYYDPSGTSFYNKPVNMLDGTCDTYFYDQRAQFYNTVSNIHVSLEYPVPKKVTGYRWNRPTTMEGTHTYLPTSWAVLGSEDMVNWRTLSQVDYLETSWSTNWREYPCTNYPHTVASVGNIDVGANAKLTVCGPELSIGDAALSENAVLSVSDGAQIVLPSDCEISKLAVGRDGGGGAIVNFNPAAEGELYVTGGTGSARGALPVFLENPVSDDLRNWKVYVNGVLNLNVGAAVIDGQLHVINTVGFVITIK